MLKSEGKKEKKELAYEATSVESTKNFTKKYGILAKRDQKDSWTQWTEVNSLDRALHHLNRCRELGYLAKIVDMPIEYYHNRGAREMFRALQDYIIKNEIQISNENLDGVLKEVLKRVLKERTAKE